MATYLSEILATPGLQNYWRLGEVSGDAIDVVSGRNGTFGGSVVRGISGIPGGRNLAAEFSGGSGSVVVIPDAPSLDLSTGTVELWFSTTDAGSGHRVMFAKQNAYGVRFLDNVLGIYDWGATAFRSTGVDPTDGEWHHVVHTFQSGVASGSKIYLDGALILTTTMTVSNQLEGIAFGAGDDLGGTERYSGYLDEIALYTTILTPEQIALHYDLGSTVPVSMLPVSFARWRSGGVTVGRKLYRATRDNEWVEDLSDIVLSGAVNWNADRGAGVKLSSKFRLADRISVDPHNDFLAPVLTLTWDDGVVEEQQYGLFLTDWPEDFITPAVGLSDITGLDPTWILWNSAIRDTKNAAAAANQIAFVAGLATEAGWDRFDFPASTKTFDVARSWWPPERRFTIMGKVLEGMGWYHPYSDLTGYIRSRPFIDLARAEPALKITADDPIGQVKIIPTTATLANVVVVRKAGVAEEAPLVGIAENADPFDPISTANREVILREIDAPDAQTQAEVDALALEYLRQGSSYYLVLQVELAPGVWPGPYQVVDVELHSDIWGCLCGRYHVREWTVGFSPGDNLKVELNRVVHFTHEDV